MFDRRQEPRAAAETEVRITALNENGSSFTQTVTAKNLSTGGALLNGLDHKLRCGDLVKVQHGNQQARFRVVWIANSAHGPFTAAIHKLKDERCPWAEVLTESVAGISNS